MSDAYKFHYYKGVRYVAAGNPAPATFARCGTCGRAWDDAKSTGLTPAPSGRCPFEYMHNRAGVLAKAFGLETENELARKAYQPKTGVRCSCKRGIERDNCAACEGTGWRVDFAAIRARSGR